VPSRVSNVDPPKTGDDDTRHASLRISGDEAYLMRAKKTMRPPSPRDTEPDKERLAPGATKDAAARMMAAMGWQRGQGLGRDAQGIVQPLQAGVSKGRVGVGSGSYEEEDVGPSPPTAQQFTGRRVSASSRVIVLTNMALPEEVDDELESETAEECSKFGKVINCVVHEVKDAPPEFAVQLFVEFGDSEVCLVW